MFSQNERNFLKSQSLARIATAHVVVSPTSLPSDSSSTASIFTWAASTFKTL
jgi:hypothetical protein